MKKSASWSASFPGGHAEGYPDTFKQFFKAFYGYIHEGNFDFKPHFPTFKDGHNMLLVEEAILKSAKEKQWMDVVYS